MEACINFVVLYIPSEGFYRGAQHATKIVSPSSYKKSYKMETFKYMKKKTINKILRNQETWLHLGYISPSCRQICRRWWNVRVTRTTLYVCVHISIGPQGEGTPRRAPRRPPSHPSRQQRPNIAQSIWELMNQLRVIGPPPSRNDCLGFLRSIKDLRHSNNALNYGHCSALNRHRGASVPGTPSPNLRATRLLFISPFPIANVAFGGQHQRNS